MLCNTNSKPDTTSPARHSILNTRINRVKPPLPRPPNCAAQGHIAPTCQLSTTVGGIYQPHLRNPPSHLGNVCSLSLRLPWPKVSRQTDESATDWTRRDGTDGPANRRMDGQTGGWTDGRDGTNGPTDRRRYRRNRQATRRAKQTG